jgi:hypothetical protein
MHQQTNQQEEETTFETSQAYCDICDQSFSSKSCLNRHNKRKHSLKTPENYGNNVIQLPFFVTDVGKNILESLYLINFYQVTSHILWMYHKLLNFNSIFLTLQI